MTDTAQAEPFERITVAAVGDWYADDPAKERFVVDAEQTRDAIIAASPTLVLGLGDFSYEGKSPEGFIEFIEPLNAGIPIYPAYGNHDGLRDGILTRPNFYQQLRELFVVEDEWYSFDVGPIHFISINSEYPRGTSQFEEQYEDLEADLAEASADGTVRMIIPFFHRAMANPISPDGPDPTLQELVFPLLDRYREKIPIALQAHHHVYTRTHAIAYSAERDTEQCRKSGDEIICQAVHRIVDAGSGSDPTVYRGDGIVFATVGTGGGYPTGLTPDGPFMAVRHKPVSATENDPDAGTFGFLLLTIDYDGVVGEFRANNGDILDHFLIAMP